MTKFRCFGFYNDSPTCNTCVATERCRAIMISDGSDLIEALLDEILAGDPGTLFFDTDRPSEMVTQLLHPEKRAETLAQQGVIDELFGDEDDGPFAADVAARQGIALDRIGAAMKGRDKGEFTTDDNDGLEID